MIARTLTLASLFVVVSPLCAAAGEAAYKAEDIVKFFTANANQGATRGICVGTAEECEVTQAKPKPFDLLVNFDKNSANLTEPARDNLMEFSKALKDPHLTGARFEVEGHTDASGTENYNLSLSERRAKAVVTFLSEQGVDTSKLIAKGYGEASPLTSDAYDPQNRRVQTRMVIQ